MHLTQQTDYALRVLIYVAANRDKQVNITHIADDFGISKSHVMKVVSHLVRGGYLLSARGKGGGIRLAKAPVNIGIGEVVRLLEPVQIVECMSTNNRCHISSCCQLAGILAGATKAFLQHLDRFTLEDLLDNQTIALLYQQPN